MTDRNNSILSLQMVRHCRQITMDWLESLINFVHKQRAEGVVLRSPDIAISVLCEQAYQRTQVEQYQEATDLMQEATMCREQASGPSKILLSDMFFEYAEIVGRIPGLEKIRLQSLEIAVRLSKKEMEERKTKHEKMEDALNMARLEQRPRWFRK